MTHVRTLALQNGGCDQRDDRDETRIWDAISGEMRLSARYQARNANPVATIRLNATGHASIGNWVQSSRRSSSNDATMTIPPDVAN